MDFDGDTLFLGGLLLGYILVIAVLLAFALRLELTNRSGKMSRAMLISALAGIIVPLTTYLSYPYFVPSPTMPPTSTVDQNSIQEPIQVLLSIQLTALQGIGYELSRITMTFFYGVLAMAGIFLFSPLFPSGRRKDTKQVFQTAN